MEIRKMSHDDLDIMAKWLNTKEVLKFFGDPELPPSVREIHEKYGPRIDGLVAVEPYIVETEGEPFAFMQCYRLTDEDYKSFGYSIEETIYGIDQFIGEPELLGKGYGTQMVTEFLSFVFNEKGADAVVVDPELINPRAIRCYEKCGFQKIKQIDGDRKWLMEITRAR